MRISSRHLPVIQYDDHYALIGYYGKDLIYNPQITCLSQKSPLQNSAGHSTCRKPFNGWFYFKWCQALFTQFRIEIDKCWDEFEMKYFLLVKSSVHSARSRGPNIKLCLHLKPYIGYNSKGRTGPDTPIPTMDEQLL